MNWLRLKGLIRLPSNTGKIRYRREKLSSLARAYDRMVEEASVRCQRRLANIVRCIARCSLRPICISGGNEDILGLGYGVHLGRTIARGTTTNLTLGNLDCHGNYKSLEERGAHSGNGFSFLNAIGCLKPGLTVKTMVIYSSVHRSSGHVSTVGPRFSDPRFSDTPFWALNRGGH
eukprot:sb/3471958/